MVNVTQGYYTETTNSGVFHFFMNSEPPDGQFILIGSPWKPLIDGWSLMDKIIDGDPEVSDPVRDPPEGVPPYEPPSHRNTVKP
jgi:hypothetical protein